MCGIAAQMAAILMMRKRIALPELAERMEMSERNVRRWVERFGGSLPLRIERGVVILDQDDGY